MAIVNRDLDASQQKVEYNYVSNFVGATTVSTGSTGYIAMIASPGVIQSARFLATGLSGAMSVLLGVYRPGAGGTLIACGISAAILVESGATGVLGYSGLAATGSTLLLVQAGDALHFQTGVANTAARVLMIEVVVKKTQDIVSCNGVSL